MEPLTIALIVAVFTLIVLFSGIPIAFGLSFVSVALLVAFEGVQMLEVSTNFAYNGACTNKICRPKHHPWHAMVRRFQVRQSTKLPHLITRYLYIIDRWHAYMYMYCSRLCSADILGILVRYVILVGAQLERHRCRSENRFRKNT